jgi:copper chaperone NosL
MSKFSRISLLISSLLLISVFIFPLWQIRLDAPQYPDGLILYIHINKIDGSTPHDLKNINLLNHYIGMREIEPDDIPELSIMPYFVIGFILLGILAFFLKKKWLFYTWVALFIFAGMIALYDFYMWEYDYGHNLDPRAPIKLPGETYQPPFLGSKQLLNIKATSLPQIAGILMFVSIFLSGFAVVRELLLKRKKLN